MVVSPAEVEEVDFRGIGGMSEIVVEGAVMA